MPESEMSDADDGIISIAVGESHSGTTKLQHQKLFTTEYVLIFFEYLID